MEIIFATFNNGKMAEAKAILHGFGFEAHSLEEFGIIDSVLEDGATFEENAVKKAEYYTQLLSNKMNGRHRADGNAFDASNYWIIADDSGIEIDALNGQPGVYSARFLGEATPYAEKNRKILDMMTNVPEERRSARFVCVMACVRLDKTDAHVLYTQGAINGRIAYEAAGENGFGYDPIFFLPKFGKTAAQLTDSEKNAVSHRGQALREMCCMLCNIQGFSLKR